MNWRNKTLSDRVWWAYQCMPRNQDGDLPTIREIERANGLANAAIQKWIHPKHELRPSAMMLDRIASALRTTSAFLLHGEGDPPMTSWPTLPKPAKPNNRGHRRRDSGVLPVTVPPRASRQAK
jgi:transcriptional regulator with XRE-family HTH domain